MNMKLLSVVTPPYLYQGCSTQNKVWEGNFTLGKFAPVNMKSCSRRNVRKHREIKNDEKYTTLDISLKFDSMDDMKMKSSYAKDYLDRSRKGLVASLGLKTIVRLKKNIKVKVCHY